MDEENRTLDHILPRYLGGGDEDANMAPACRPCNGRKSHLTVEQFRQKIIQGLTKEDGMCYRFAFEIHGWRMEP